MQMGMVGLGRMGANLVRRLMRDGHDCVVYDVNAQAVATLQSEGAVATGSLDQFVAALTPPRTAWVMVPAALTGDTIDALASRMSEGDVICLLYTSPPPRASPPSRSPPLPDRRRRGWAAAPRRSPDGCA